MAFCHHCISAFRKKQKGKKILPLSWTFETFPKFVLTCSFSFIFFCTLCVLAMLLGLVFLNTSCSHPLSGPSSNLLLSLAANPQPSLPYLTRVLPIPHGLAQNNFPCAIAIPLVACSWELCLFPVVPEHFGSFFLELLDSFCLFISYCQCLPLMR